MLDRTIIIGFFILCIVVGLRRNRISNFHDFITIPNNLKTGFALFATIFATSVSNSSILKLSQELYIGHYEYMIAYLLSTIWLFIIAKYLVPKIVRYNGYTIGDIFHSAYGRFGQVLIGVCSVAFSIVHFSAKVVGCGILFESLLGINPILGVLICYSIVIFYSTIGGTTAVIKTDILQLIAMFVGLILLFLIVLFFPDQGGYGKLPAANMKIESSRFIANSLALTLTFTCMTFYPQFVQRMLLSKETKILSTALINSIYAYLLFIFIIAFISIKGQVLFGDIAEGENIIFVIHHLLPKGITGLITVCLVAALMSTADSDLNTAIICLCRDLLQDRDVSDYKMLYIARGFTCIFGVSFIYFAVKFPNLLDLLIFLSHFWAPGILVPFIGILYGKILSQTSLLISMMLSVTSSYLWDMLYIGAYKLPGILVGCIVSLVTFWIFHKTKDRNKTYYWS